MTNGIRMITALAASAAVAGCVGGGGGGAGGGGGGGGGGGTPSAYDHFVDKVEATGPTLNLPKSGTGTYEGEVKVMVPTDATDASKDAIVMGDLALTVGFASGNDSTLSGTADNFRATAHTGETEALAGSLALDTDFSELARAVLPMGAGETGTIQIKYEGQLEFDGTAADVDLFLMGPARGNAAKYYTGVANFGVDMPSGSGVADFIGHGGSFYLEKK